MAQDLIRPASRPKVSNLTLTNADTEYSFAFRPTVARFLVRARQAAGFQLSFLPGESGTNYLEIRSGEVYEELEVYGDLTMYVQSSTMGLRLEILEWVR